MKNIIYATDFSENSVMALKYAEDISSKAGANLVVMHVFDTPTILNSHTKAPTFPQIEEDIRDEITEKLKRFCKDHLVTLGFRIETIMNHSVVNGIISKSVKIGSDLIVIGVHGQSKIHEMIMGHAAKGLIRNSICPVLIVPENARLRAFDNILYSTDFEDEDIEGIRRLVEIAKIYTGKIKVIHVAVEDDLSSEDEMNWFKEMLKEQVNYPLIEFELRFHEDVVDCFDEYIDEQNPSLMVMLEREKNNLQQWIYKDLVVDLAFRSTIPLLSYSERNLSLSTRIEHFKPENKKES